MWAALCVFSCQYIESSDRLAARNLAQHSATAPGCAVGMEQVGVWGRSVVMSVVAGERLESVSPANRKDVRE